MSSASVALPRRARGRIRVLRRRAIVFGVLALIISAVYMLWFRDSSLVAVKTVKVEGTGSTGVEKQLDGALVTAGLDMTTLHIRQGALDDAARQFPIVESVSADPSFPSSLTVKVIERQPAALIGSDSGAVAVAGDGTILRGVSTDHMRLPQLPLSTPPKGPRLQGPVLVQAEVLGAAPKALLREVDHSFNSPSGVGVTLDGGVQLVFGDASQAVQKWRAAAAVLSDPALGPLDYVDLSVPGRPAVGGAGHSPPPISSG
jgi:cell division protein FtsQ